MSKATFNRGEAQRAMDEWRSIYPALPAVNDDDLRIRLDIQEINRRIRSDESAVERKSEYWLDVQMGLAIYEYFWRQPGFSMRKAADDGFWRYLSVMVVPDVVAQRWGKDNDDHFWGKPTRVWLRSLWWYVHLAWQGDEETTRRILDTPHFSTDTILNFEERNGRNGTCVEAYRQIIRMYSMVPENIIKQHSRNHSGKSDDLFRIVMKLNTAKMMVMEPALYNGGECAYALSLFADAGVNLDAAQSD